MQKLTAMMAVLLAGTSLAGCYSKSCDTACPGQKMEVANAADASKAAKTDTAPETKEAPAPASELPAVPAPAPPAVPSPSDVN